MKVQITKEAKKWMTLAEAPLARSIIDEFKDPEMYGNERAEELLERAARAYLEGREITTGRRECGFVENVLTAKAEICGNHRVHNYYSDNSGRLDVYVKGIVQTSRGFLEIGAYISDIWELGSDEAALNLYNHCYQRMFVELEEN